MVAACPRSCIVSCREPRASCIPCRGDACDETLWRLVSESDVLLDEGLERDFADSVLDELFGAFVDALVVLVGFVAALVFRHYLLSLCCIRRCHRRRIVGTLIGRGGVLVVGVDENVPHLLLAEDDCQVTIFCPLLEMGALDCDKNPAEFFL